MEKGEEPSLINVKLEPLEETDSMDIPPTDSAETTPPVKFEHVELPLCFGFIPPQGKPIKTEPVDDQEMTYNHEEESLQEPETSVVAPSTSTTDKQVPTLSTSIEDPESNAENVKEVYVQVNSILRRALHNVPKIPCLYLGEENQVSNDDDQFLVEVNTNLSSEPVEVKEIEEKPVVINEKCPHCDQLFTDPDKLNAHFISANYCKFCRHIYTSQKSYYLHILQNHFLRHKKICDFCDGKKYKFTEAEIMLHMTTHSNLRLTNIKKLESDEEVNPPLNDEEVNPPLNDEKVSDGDNMDGQFVIPEAAVKPVSKNEKPKPEDEEAKYKCKHCAKIFTNSTDLDAHYTSVNFCKLCSFIFNNQKNFWLHLCNKHYNRVKNTCDFCQRYKFNFTDSDIIEHMAMHANVNEDVISSKPVDTSDNESKVVEETQDVSNVQTQKIPLSNEKEETSKEKTEEGSHSCKHCAKTFDNISTLDKHYSSVMFCKFCCATFGSPQNYFHHLLHYHYHRRTNTCDFCIGTKFNFNETEIKHHMSTHANVNEASANVNKNKDEGPTKMTFPTELLKYIKHIDPKLDVIIELNGVKVTRKNGIFYQKRLLPQKTTVIVPQKSEEKPKLMKKLVMITPPIKKGANQAQVVNKNSISPDIRKLIAPKPLPSQEFNKNSITPDTRKLIALKKLTLIKSSPSPPPTFYTKRNVSLQNDIVSGNRTLKSNFKYKNNDDDDSVNNVSIIHKLKNSSSTHKTTDFDLISQKRIKLESEIINNETLDSNYIEPEMINCELLDPEMIDPEVMDCEDSEPYFIEPGMLQCEITEPETNCKETELEPEMINCETLEPEFINYDELKPEINIDENSTSSNESQIKIPEPEPTKEYIPQIESVFSLTENSSSSQISEAENTNNKRNSTETKTVPVIIKKKINKICLKSSEQKLKPNTLRIANISAPINAATNKSNKNVPQFVVPPFLPIALPIITAPSQPIKKPNVPQFVVPPFLPITLPIITAPSQPIKKPLTIKKKVENLSYECGMCPRRFALKSLLTHHRNLNHLCKICNRTYLDRSELIRHLQRTFPCNTNFNCNFCEHISETRSDHFVHLNLHLSVSSLVSKMS